MILAAYVLQAGAVVATLGIFLLVRRNGRPGILAIALPLVVMSLGTIWFLVTYKVIQGFRQMALAGSGGMSYVTSVLSKADQGAYHGHLASLAALAVLAVLGVVLLPTKHRAR